MTAANSMNQEELNRIIMNYSNAYVKIVSDMADHLFPEDKAQLRDFFYDGAIKLSYSVEADQYVDELSGATQNLIAKKNKKNLYVRSTQNLQHLLSSLCPLDPFC